jgi:hypothetical protein
MTKTTRAVVVALGVAAVVAVAGVIAWRRGALQPFGLYRPANALMVIAPYKYAGTWVIDDPAVGLNREPFVSGIPEMIDEMVRDIPDADKGFRLLFSAQPFPGRTHKLIWRRGDETGNWYYCEQYDKEGWLCPGLFRYYQKAPQEIYAKAEKR